MMLLTCRDWESCTKSLWTVWLVSTWERRLITWLRSSRHCCCRAAWCKTGNKEAWKTQQTDQKTWGNRNCSWKCQPQIEELTLSLVRDLLVPWMWDSATRRASSSVRQASSSACIWSFWAAILSVSVFRLDSCTAHTQKHTRTHTEYNSTETQQRLSRRTNSENSDSHFIIF